MIQWKNIYLKWPDTSFVVEYIISSFSLRYNVRLKGSFKRKWVKHASSFNQNTFMMLKCKIQIWTSILLIIFCHAFIGVIFTKFMDFHRTFQTEISYDFMPFGYIPTAIFLNLRQSPSKKSHWCVHLATRSPTVCDNRRQSPTHWIAKVGSTSNEIKVVGDISTYLKHI